MKNGQQIVDKKTNIVDFWRIMGILYTYVKKYPEKRSDLT